MGRFCVFLVLIATAATSAKGQTQATPKESKVYHGHITPDRPKRSTKSLQQDDLLLVSVSPSNSAGFQVVDSNQAALDAVSFEHLGAKKKYVFLAEHPGKYELILHSLPGQEKASYELTVEHVSGSATANERLKRVLGHWHSPANPGGALTVTRNGQAEFIGTFGAACVEQGTLATESTVFDTASLAKHVTGLAIAMLAREGKLSLEDDIRKHIPEVPDFGNPITVEHLLHHTSGLRDFPGLMLLGDWHDHDVITLDQVVRLVGNQQELNFPPGTEFTYSNTGYSLLAEMVHRVTGKTLADWTKENLFIPLGMQNTRFLTGVNEVVPERANGYSLVDPTQMIRQPNSLAAMGSSSFLTTARDMSLWMANFDSMKVGGENIRDLMTQRGRTGGGENLGYGFGIGHGEYRSLRHVEHGGSSGGFRSHLLRFPQQRFSVAVLSNQGNFDPASLAYLAAKLYLNDQLDDKVTKRPSVKPTKKEEPGDLKIDIATLDTYVGSYEIQPGEVIEVSREGDGLVLRPKGHPEAPPIIAKPLSRTRFTGPPNGSIEFVAGKSGKITKGLIRNGETIITEAKRLDQPKKTVDLRTYEGKYFCPELSCICKLVVDDNQLVAQQPKRTRHLSQISGDNFGTDDGFNFEFVRDGTTIREFRASTGPRVRQVRFVKVSW